ncbi:MAG: PAS domain-containing protein, partial [Bacteroidota bacterium]
MNQLITVATTNDVHKQEGNKQMTHEQHLGPWFWEDAAAQDWVSDDVIKAFGLDKDFGYNGPMAAIWRYLHPLDAQDVETHRFDPFIEFSENSFSCEFRLKPPSSNEYLHIRRTSEVIKRYASGRPSKIIGNFYLLHPEASQTSVIANASPDRLYIIKTDFAGKYTYVNDFFLQRFQLKQEEVIGISSLEHILESDHPICNAAVVEAFSKPGERVEVTFRKPHPTQGVVWTDWEFEASLDDQGRLEGITCFGIDITESKRLETELEKTQATLASIFSTMDEVVWSVQLPEYKTLYTSPSVS